LVRWLGFASGAAIASIGLVSLIAHELRMESDMDWAITRFSTHATFRGLSDDDSGANTREIVKSEQWS
jgi:hypothetical protein